MQPSIDWPSRLPLLGDLVVVAVIVVVVVVVMVVVVVVVVVVVAAGAGLFDSLVLTQSIKPKFVHPVNYLPQKERKSIT